MNELATVPTMSFDEVERLADYIAKSGLFGMKTPSQAVILMMISQAEGRHPALAARDYDIINNRQAKKSEAMHRDFLTGGGKIKWHSLTDTEADATFTHPLGGEVRITWDMARARQAGFENKENYKKYPRAMLRARTVSEGVRTVWPVATSGMYVPEEVVDMPPGEPPFAGTTVEHNARDAINDSVPLKAAAARTPHAERIVDPTVYDTRPPDAPEPPRSRSVAEWLVALDISLHDATSRVDVDKILDREDVLMVTQKLKGGALERYTTIKNAALERHPPVLPDDMQQPVDDELAIVGEEKVLAG